MKAVLGGILAIALAAPAAAAAEPGKLWMAQIKGGWCAYRDQSAFTAATRDQNVVSRAEVTRPASGQIEIMTEVFSEAGDWRLTDWYQFAPAGGGSVRRNAVILSTNSRLDANYDLAAGEVKRTKYRHRKLYEDSAASESWVPKVDIRTAATDFPFWSLVGAMDAAPGEVSLCRKP